MNAKHCWKHHSSTVEKSSKAWTQNAGRRKVVPSTNQMGRARAICEEFSDAVVVGARVLESEDYSLREIEEIKCSLDTKCFSGLLERMSNVRYCCTKAERDQGLEKCIAWFEPQLLD
jgi:hypothetical protein